MATALKSSPGFDAKTGKADKDAKIRKQYNGLSGLKAAATGKNR